MHEYFRSLFWRKFEAIKIRFNKKSFKNGTKSLNFELTTQTVQYRCSPASGPAEKMLANIPCGSFKKC